MTARPRLLWFWPERDRYRPAPAWAMYRRVAQGLGADFDAVSVDDVTLATTDAGSTAFVRGRPVDRGSTVINNKIYTWPAFVPDIWRSLAAFRRLRAAGYLLMHDDALNLLAHDKAATLADLAGVAGPVLPTVAVETRQLDRLPEHVLPSAGIDFPVMMKPGQWGGGMGAVRARDAAELTMAIRLASSAELSIVVQPLLPTSVVDIRVYCLEGRPLLSAFRTAGEGQTVANLAGGGRAWLDDVPERLRDRASAAAARCGADWMAVDFLSDGPRDFLSEIEIDPYMSDDHFPDDRSRYESMMRARLRLALERLEAHR